jgi:hypothetical protein
MLLIINKAVTSYTKSLRTDWLTNSMHLSTNREATSCAVIKKCHSILQNPEEIMSELSKGPKRVGVSPTWRQRQIQFPKHYVLLLFRILDYAQNP